MRRVWLWIAGVLALLILIVVGGVMWLESPGAATWAAQRLSAMTGRQIQIEGPVDIDWGWNTHLSVSGIKVANADWGTEPLMADIRQLGLTVRLAPLLRGQLEFPEITLEQPKMLLETNREGKGNWTFSENPAAAQAAETAAPEDRSEFPLIGRLIIREGQLTYRDPVKEVDIASRLNTVAGQENADGKTGDDQISLKGEGSLQGKPLNIELRAGSLLSLRETDRPYPVDMNIRAGQTQVRMAGAIKEPVKLQGADLNLSLQGANLAEIFPLFGIPVPTTAPYSLRGDVIRREGLWQVNNLKGKVGESDISGWLSLEPREPRPLIKAELTSKQLRLNDLAGFIGLDPAADQRNEQTVSKEEDKVIPDTEIVADRLKAADMDITFTGDDVQVPVLPLEEVHFRFRLNNGLAQLEPVRFKAEIGQVSGAMRLDGRTDVPAAAFDLTIRQIGLKPFFKGTDFVEETAGSIGGRINLQGRGESLSQILGSSQGQVVAIMQGGRISNLVMEAAGIDIAEALGNLVAGDEAVQVRCLVADFTVDKGMMTSQTLVFDTTDTKITGEAALNLKNERLGARFVAEPKDPSPLSGRTPVTIGGTLSNPQIGVEEEGLLLRGGAAVALGILLTPLAAIIPFLEPGIGEDSPCQALIQQASQP